jgi:hypothetical protein
VYVAGFTESVDFPIRNAFQAAFSGEQDAFLTKFNANGSAIIYSTYLGGISLDSAHGIAVDSSKQVYLAGLTGSDNFPTRNAVQPSFGSSCSPGSDFCHFNAFVTKFSSTGRSLVYSTYLGGFDARAAAIAVDAKGNAYVTGMAFEGFPTTAGAFQRTWRGGGADAFVAKLSPGTGRLLYSTYLGGSCNDLGQGIALNSLGQAHVTGNTCSTNFPLKGSLRSTPRLADVFVTKFWSSGSGLHYSTLVGGEGDDFGDAIRLDGSGNAYVTGFTRSSMFPTTVGAFQRTRRGSADAFVLKIKP